MSTWPSDNILNDAPQTGQVFPDVLGFFGVARLPTDPLFYSGITLEGIVVGSRYWIAPQNDLSNVLASGEAATTTVVIPDIPAYANPQLLELRVRKSSGGAKYLPLNTYAYQTRDGAFFYISQVVDGIAS